ncbi:MAG: diguanylate cyclase domain-containing protein, partial [Pyrinomonadaceae bacterium]
MNFERLTKAYMILVLLAGTAAFCLAVTDVPVERIDLYFFALVCFTIGIGSRMSIKIPRLKSHISVSDTFIYLAILLFGGELAVVLAAVEAFFSARRFCSSLLAVYFNAGAMALSTSIVVAALKVAGLDSESQLHGHAGHVQDFIIALSVIAIVQFLVNTGLAAVYDSLKNASKLPDLWKREYVWSFATYLIGAVCAGVLVQLSDLVGYGVIIAAFPVAYLVFLTYRMYLANVEMSISQAKQAEEYAKKLEQQSVELKDSERRFRSAFNFAPIGIALVSPAGHWLKVNRALSEILGYKAEEFLSSDFQSMIFREDVGPTFSLIHDLIEGRVASSQMEQRYVHKNGHTVWVSWSGSIASDTNSTNPTLIFQVHDITDKKHVEQQLRHEATHDALTGLPNRAYFMQRLADSLNKFRDNPKYQVSVLFIDLDRFKNVNDSLGHLVGDQLLISISERLTECMRPPDIVARLGGDEFVILVEGRYYNETVTIIAERIQKRFSIPFKIGSHEIYSSASIGILHASNRHRTP